jgi:hypothetical protein
MFVIPHTTTLIQSFQNIFSLRPKNLKISKAAVVVPTKSHTKLVEEIK